MSIVDSSYVCTFTAVEDETQFQDFLRQGSTGIKLLTEKYGLSQHTVFKADGGHFAKWLRINNPSLLVTVDCEKPRLMLRNSDIWLPLAFLATDVAFPIYLNLVSSYLYDRTRGSLKGEKTHVHFSAEYEDKAEGKIKRFNFEGDAEALQKVIKQFDVNKFLDE